MNRLLPWATAVLVTAALTIPPVLGAAAAPGHDRPTTTATTGEPGPRSSGWETRPTPQGTWLTWTAKKPLPITNDRPTVLLDGVSLGPAVVRGARVSVRVPEAPADLGELDVVLSGRSLITGRTAGRAAGALKDLPPGPVFAIDPATAGPFTTTSSDYVLPPLAAGLGRRLPVRGHVVKPVDGPAGAPLVLFLHGRHQPCYTNEAAPAPDPEQPRQWSCPAGMSPVPSDLGYLYLQQRLASQGYVTVSIDANAINDLDWRALDGGAQARGLLIRRHLSAWADWAASGQHRLDPHKVVLVGHSRGGEGANRAAELGQSTDSFRVVGQVLIGPTNFARQSAARTPTVTILPGCDGDVSDLQGQSFTDVAATVTDDSAVHSSVLIPGTNHNFFNTEWTPATSVGGSVDDGRWVRGCRQGDVGRLGARQQRAMGLAYVTGAAAYFTRTMPGVEQLFDGTLGHVSSAGSHPVRTHAVGGERSAIDLSNSRLVGSGPMMFSTCEGSAGGGEFRMAPCDGQLPVPHWPSAWDPIAEHPVVAHLAWDKPSGSGGFKFPARDFGGTTAIDLRVVVPPGPGVRIQARVTDASGASATVTPVDGELVPGLARPRDNVVAGGVWGQTVRIETARLSGVDLSRVTAVELTTRSDTGSLWLLDAWAVRGPGTRLGENLPAVQLGSAETIEGDEPRVPMTTQVPYTITGTVTAPAQFIVGVVEPGAASVVRSVVVDVPPGTTSGTVSVPYTGNRVDDPDRRTVYLDARPRHGIMPTANVSTLQVIDDDPTPALRGGLVSTTVREGGRVRIRVQVAKPVGYDIQVVAYLAPPKSGKPLRWSDLPKAWRLMYAGPDVDPRKPVKISLMTVIPAGDTSALVVVPIRTDRSREGVERLRVRIHSTQPILDRTVHARIVDR